MSTKAVAERLDYSSSSVPKNYECYDCEVRGVKLWRQYQTFADHIQLLCLKCACKNQNEQCDPTEDGKSLYHGEPKHWYRTSDMEEGWWTGWDPKKDRQPIAAQFKAKRDRHDQIGWLVPAIPDEECETYWGYTSVPQPGCEWWYRLPYFLPEGAC